MPEAAPAAPAVEAPATPAAPVPEKTPVVPTQKPAASATPPSPTTKTDPKPVLSSDLAALTQRQVEARKTQVAAKREAEKQAKEHSEKLAAIEARAKALEEKEAKYKELESLRSGAPLKWLEANGLTMEQMVDFHLREGKLTPEQQATFEASKVKEELSKELSARDAKLEALMKQLESEKAAREKSETEFRQREEQRAQEENERWMANYQQQARAEVDKAADDFPFIALENETADGAGHSLVWNVMVESAKAVAQGKKDDYGRPLVEYTAKQAAAVVEEQLRKNYGPRAKKMLTDPKYSGLLGLKLAEPAVTAPAQSATARTPPPTIRVSGVSNANASAPPSPSRAAANGVSTPEERRKRAMALLSDKP